MRWRQEDEYKVFFGYGEPEASLGLGTGDQRETERDWEAGKEVGERETETEESSSDSNRRSSIVPVGRLCLAYSFVMLCFIATYI